MKYQIRDPEENRFGGIDLEIEIQPDNWIPFTASPDDPEPFGVQIYNEVKANGNFVKYKKPTKAAQLKADREALIVTRFQFRKALLETDLLESVKTALDDSIDAQLIWEAGEIVRRVGPMGTLLESILSAKEVDELFNTALSVKE